MDSNFSSVRLRFVGENFNVFGFWFPEQGKVEASTEEEGVDQDKSVDVTFSLGFGTHPPAEDGYSLYHGLLSKIKLADNVFKNTLIESNVTYQCSVAIVTNYQPHGPTSNSKRVILIASNQEEGHVELMHIMRTKHPDDFIILCGCIDQKARRALLASRPVPIYATDGKNAFFYQSPSTNQSTYQLSGRTMGICTAMIALTAIGIGFALRNT